MSDTSHPSTEPVQGKRRFRPRRAALVWLGLITSAAAFHFSDDRLEPAEDLKPLVRPLPEVQNNGYVYFQNRISRESREIQSSGSQQINALRRAGQNDWRVFMTARKVVLEKLRTELEVALEKPWIQPPNQDAGDHAKITSAIPLMVCDFSLALETGDRARAWSLLANIQRLSVALLRSSPDFDSLETGLHVQRYAAEMVCEFVAEAKPTAEELVALEKTWAIPSLGKEELRGVLNFETDITRAALIMAGQKMIHTSLVFLQNRSQNRLHAQVRRMDDALLEPRATRGEALDAIQSDAVPPTRTLRSKLDRNAAGREFVDSAAAHLWERQNSLGPRVLFQSRAILVRLALHRWQSAHAGELPEMLEALVPEYLPSVPADPWSGRPLLWASTGGIIFSVGPTWQTPGIPLFLKVLTAFKADLDGLSRPWFSGLPDSPALRLTLPPPLPPTKAPSVPAPGKLKKRSPIILTNTPLPIPPEVPAEASPPSLPPDPETIDPEYPEAEGGR